MTTPRILLIRLSSLGDIVLTMPLIRALRMKYPDAVIDLLVKKEFASLARRFEGLSHVLEFDTTVDRISPKRAELQSHGYTHILDLHNSLRSKLLRRINGATISIIEKHPIKRYFLVDLKLDFLREEPDAVGRYFETAKALGIVDDASAPTFGLPPTVEDSKLIALCPGSKHYNKQWPAEKFAELASMLIEKGFDIECFGSKSEHDLANYILTDLPADRVRNRCGEIALEDLPEEFARCNVAITNDSGLLHIAAASGIPTISMFGPTVRSLGFFPRSKEAIVLEVEKLRCRPCTTIGMSRCPKGHFRCMREITVGMVIEKIPILN